MILPSRKLLVFLAIPVPLLLLIPSPAMAAGAGAYDLALLVVVVIDLARSPGPRHASIRRLLPARLSLNARNEVGWHIRNHADATLSVLMRDDVPDPVRASGLPVHARIRQRSHSELRYQVRPTQRGQYEFGDIWARFPSRLGLVVRHARYQRRDPVKVYPDTTGIGRYELAAWRHRLSEMGLTSVRRLGRGSVFESLREYVPGDDLGDVAWKASARRGRLMIRNYEAERNQNVLLMIDCGRVMSAQVDRLSRLDHAVNAALLLAHVATKQGDAVGMIAFSDRIESFMPLRKGPSARTVMNESLYRIEPRMREPDYDQACRFLATRQRKRSLVIVLTDVVDTEASAALLAHTASFTRRHLPLCVALANPELQTLARGPAERADDCYRQAVAVQVLDRRQRALARMRQSGVDVLDTDPRHATPKLIDRYLRLKSRNRL